MSRSQVQEIEAAFQLYRGPLERYLTIMTRDREVAEDLAQEAFLRLSREVRAGRRPDDIAAWLHRVGANLAKSRGRHLQVVDRRAGDLPRPADPMSPELQTVRAELVAATGRLLADLSIPERQALLLAAQGYPGPEIAARVGRSPGAIRTLLCRTRAKLRRELTDAGFSYA